MARTTDRPVYALFSQEFNNMGEIITSWNSSLFQNPEMKWCCFFHSGCVPCQNKPLDVGYSCCDTTNKHWQAGTPIIKLFLHFHESDLNKKPETSVGHWTDTSTTIFNGPCKSKYTWSKSSPCNLADIITVSGLWLSSTLEETTCLSPLRSRDD